ncbi:hypothetical protein GE09DRAFT_529789 [Coniochaeta sp. 2T2.1]|nr:hypothetical protein GE09DRAFT_529789 [Coniochaeta sp. 2T2.1]
MGSRFSTFAETRNPIPAQRVVTFVGITVIFPVVGYRHKIIAARSRVSQKVTTNSQLPSCQQVARYQQLHLLNVQKPRQCKPPSSMHTPPLLPQQGPCRRGTSHLSVVHTALCRTRQKRLVINDPRFRVSSSDICDSLHLQGMGRIIPQRPLTPILTDTCRSSCMSVRDL